MVDYQLIVLMEVMLNHYFDIFEALLESCVIIFLHLLASEKAGLRG